MLRASDASPQLPETAVTQNARPFRGFAVSPVGLRADDGSSLPPANVKDQLAPLVRNGRIIANFPFFVWLAIVHVESLHMDIPFSRRNLTGGRFVINLQASSVSN